MSDEPAPVLRRVPEHAIPSRIRPARQAAVYVLCSDGSWRKGRVIGWGRCPDGWAVLLRLGMDDVWYMHDLRALHPV